MRARGKMVGAAEYVRSLQGGRNEKSGSPDSGLQLRERNIGVEPLSRRSDTREVVVPEAPHGADNENRIPMPRTARLLVVDDEPQIGNTLRLLLQPECEVKPMTSARAALERISKGDRFDVIFCDLMMPEMSGMQFHANLLRIAPEQADAVVFMTGGAYTPSSRDFVDRMSSRCVDKPFDMTQLRGLIASRVR